MKTTLLRILITLALLTVVSACNTILPFSEMQPEFIGQPAEYLIASLETVISPIDGLTATNQPPEEINLSEGDKSLFQEDIQPNDDTQASAYPPPLITNPITGDENHVDGAPELGLGEHPQDSIPIPTQAPLSILKDIVLASTNPEWTYEVQSGSPIAMPNFIHPETRCNWLGIAGIVYDVDQVPVINIIVEVGGELDGNPVFFLTLTGMAPDYGPGGYEIVLADHLVHSRGTVWLQLYNLEGKQVSPRIYIDTFVKCNANLILLNFNQWAQKHYFPYIGGE